MLVADLNKQRIEASEAVRGPEYRCPQCQEVVILKQGRIVIHHFAHKPPVNCSWGQGETIAHREAKKLFQDEFVRRGLRVEVEHVVPSLPGDRRADVMVWSPKGSRYAIELQHTSIDYNDLERRTRSYIAAGVRLIWIPFLPTKAWEDAEKLGPEDDGDFLIKRFTARPLEKWVHGFNFGEYWIYDPSRKALWKAKLAPHEIYVESTSWYDSSGDEQYAGGYSRISKKWKELTLWGPYHLDQVCISSIMRQASEMGNHRYPGGEIGKIVARP